MKLEAAVDAFCDAMHTMFDTEGTRRAAAIPLLNTIFETTPFEKIRPAFIDETTDGHTDGDHSAAITSPQRIVAHKTDISELQSALSYINRRAASRLTCAGAALLSICCFSMSSRFYGNGGDVQH